MPDRGRECSGRPNAALIDRDDERSKRRYTGLPLGQHSATALSRAAPAEAPTAFSLRHRDLVIDTPNPAAAE